LIANSCGQFQSSRRHCYEPNDPVVSKYSILACVASRGEEHTHSIVFQATSRHRMLTLNMVAVAPVPRTRTSKPRSRDAASAAHG
jgi:hypothetical protein